MDEASLHALLSGRRTDIAARLLRAGLSVASLGYAAAVSVRNRAFDAGWLKVNRAAVPVISLGNITTGGTGKTPMAAWLANWLISAGRKPGLLSRGYRALASDADNDVSGNDEKRVLDRLCPGVPHLQQKNRVEAADRLIREHGCNVLILDDGFQHRRLHRDLNLVLIDALQPWGFGHVLPRGLLREPLPGLRRADLVIITRYDQCPVDQRQQLQSQIAELHGTAECIGVSFVPRQLTGLDGSTRPLDSLPSTRSIAFCGIGNPEGFRRTLSALGASTDLRVYPDHHHYGPTDLRELASAARSQSADVALTTLKDLVKITLETWTGPPLFAIEIGAQFPSGQETLSSRLQNVIRH